MWIKSISTAFRTLLNAGEFVMAVENVNALEVRKMSKYPYLHAKGEFVMVAEATNEDSLFRALL